MSKKSTTANFETSLQKLEEIVSAMEEESIPLEDLLKYYENGNKLIKECESSLQQARKQLEVIRKKSQTDTKTTPSTKDENNDDEIRLF